MQSEWRNRSTGWGSAVSGLRLPLLWKDLNKWVDLDPFKYTVDSIGVFASKPLRVFQRVRFDDNKTPCLIREGTSQDDPALRIQGFHFVEMRRAINFSLGLSIGAVESEDDKFHKCLEGRGLGV